MKLLDGIVLDKVGGENIAVATRAAGKKFKGLIRSNSTAAFILHELLTDTDVDSIVSKMLEEYDVEESVARADVESIVSQLEQAGLIDG